MRGTGRFCELCGHLTEEFRSANKEMPWNEIKGMRNVVAHRYGTISVEATWETIETDIPALKTFCEGILDANTDQTN